MTNYQIMLLINVFLLGFMLLSLYFTARSRKVSRQAKTDLEGARKELDTLKEQSDHNYEKFLRAKSESKETKEKFEIAKKEAKRIQTEMKTELKKTRKERDDALRQTEVSREEARQSDDACKKLEDQVGHYSEQARFTQEAYEDCQKETEDALRQVENCREQIEEERKRELVGFAKKFFPVLDKMEWDLDDRYHGDESLSASPSNNSDPNNIIKNMTLYFREIEQIMMRSGFQIIDPKGKSVDHRYHQVIDKEVREGIDPGTILSVYRKGWMFDGRIVRFADIVIAK